MVSRQITDPSELYIPKPDKGDGVAVAGRVDPEIKEQISVIVQSGKTRFEKESDFVRSATVYYLIDVVAPLLADKRLSHEVLKIRAHVRRTMLMETLASLEHYKDRNRDIFMKFAKFGFVDALREHWVDVIKSSRLYGDEFAAAVERWLDEDRKLDKARLMVGKVKLGKGSKR